MEYPKMIYHIVEEPIIVQDKDEESKYLNRGWSISPVQFDEIRAVEAKIAYHKSEVDRLSDILGVLTFAPEEKEAAPVKNKGGRPRKVEAVA